MDLQVSTPTLSTTIAATPPVAGTTVAPVTVAVVSTPPNIDQLLRQIQINGTVTTPADSGTVTLNTALGNFSFLLAQLPDDVKQQIIKQLDTLFQNQKSITAIIQPGSPPTQAVLLLPTSTGTQTTPQTSQQNLPPPPLTLSSGLSLPAVVLPPDIVVPGSTPSTATPNAPQAPLQTTTQSQTVPQQPSSPQAQSPNNIPATPPNTPAPQNVSQSAAALPLTTAQLLQPGKEVIVHIDAISLPSSPAPAPTNANQIPATVIGNGANGQLILKANDSTLYVRANVEAPVGTHLLVTLDAPKSVNPALLPPVPLPNFDTLQQTLNVLAEINPQIAQQITQTLIPQPNPQLAGPLLFFLSALKQGDVKSWLGKDATEILTKAGKIELLTKLMREIGSSVQTERDPAVGEWKSYPVPLHNNGQFQTITLHVHADGRGAGSDKTQPQNPDHVRFLIDVNMSRLGLIQLDGLVRPKKLDMIIRSAAALPTGLPQDLRNSYLSGIEAMGFTGSLSFQTGKQNWLVPRAETPQSLLT